MGNEEEAGEITQKEQIFSETWLGDAFSPRTLLDRMSNVAIDELLTYRKKPK
jgi:hypothetical protein